ncbi:MAG: RluA family pseudouridine synthase [Helicobacteraceae bacterium]|jgi:23S rRNA pseudouridine1911/1915/1917 synthase|nr:RluA family pseudouridine synthase [Helicobacteraceae bacterium]
MMEKAYKLLAAQLGVSNGEAKRLIDDGFVYSGGKRVAIARAEFDARVEFKVERPAEIRAIYEDDEMIAIDKPRGMESYDLERRIGAKIAGARLIHRLDKETSGVLCFAKTDEFLERAIAAFKRREVVKKYLAAANKVIAEEAVIDAPIVTQKGEKARSFVLKSALKDRAVDSRDREDRGERGGDRGGKSAKKGNAKPAITRVKPLAVSGKRTLLEVLIETGRTHQIRAHLAHIGAPILGDTSYGGAPFKRLMLHAAFISLLGREISAPPPAEFNALFGKFSL